MRSPSVSGTLIPAALVIGVLVAAASDVRCTARGRQALSLRGTRRLHHRARQPQRGSAAAALRAAIDPLLVDTHTGAVRFGAAQLHQ